jgi:hypothetical protein
MIRMPRNRAESGDDWFEWREMWLSTKSLIQHCFLHATECRATAVAARMPPNVSSYLRAVVPVSGMDGSGLLVPLIRTTLPSDQQTRRVRPEPTG